MTRYLLLGCRYWSSFGTFLHPTEYQFRSIFLSGLGETASKSTNDIGFMVFRVLSTSVGTLSWGSAGFTNPTSGGCPANSSFNCTSLICSSSWLIVSSPIVHANSIFSRKRNLSMHENAALISQFSSHKGTCSNATGLVAYILWSMRFDNSDHISGLHVTATPVLTSADAREFPITCSRCISVPWKKLLLVQRLTNIGAPATLSRSFIIRQNSGTMSSTSNTNLVAVQSRFQCTNSPNENHICTDAPARTSSSSLANLSTNSRAFAITSKHLCLPTASPENQKTSN